MTTLILGEIDLKYIDFLQPEATRIRCVGCQNVGLSTVRLERVTCWQHLLAFAKIRQNWDGRHDINHYCGTCGCFVGRFMHRDGRKQATRGQLKTRKTRKNWAELMQDFKEKRAKKQAKAVKKEEENAKSKNGQKEGENLTGKEIKEEEKEKSTNSEKLVIKQENQNEKPAGQVEEEQAKGAKKAEKEQATNNEEQIKK